MQKCVAVMLMQMNPVRIDEPSGVRSLNKAPLL